MFDEKSVKKLLKTNKLLDEELLYSFYSKVSSDIKNGIKDNGVWVKAFSDANGDTSKQKAIYIKLMVEKMILIHESSIEIEEEKNKILAKRKKQEKLKKIAKEKAKEEKKVQLEIQKDNEFIDKWSSSFTYWFLAITFTALLNYIFWEYDLFFLSNDNIIKLLIVGFFGFVLSGLISIFLFTFIYKD
tara:strand:+ start:73 stop:633 length:561 start_codon:yes stop_codon:yes gene_type:complete